MKIQTFYSSLLIFVFTVIIYAGIETSTGIVGTTVKNGDGCVCHSLNPDPDVWVRIEGPDTLLQGQTAQYFIKLSGGPAVEGGFNVAAFSGFLDPVDATVQKIGGELTHTSAANFSDTVVTWSFYFTPQMMNYTDTLYSVANSVNGDGIPNNSDRWNYGVNFPVVVLSAIPVELVSFTSKLIGNDVQLNWKTASETNNMGFEVEKFSGSTWDRIGFINGNGTTTETKTYSFLDKNETAGTYSYRLKQLDFDGAFEYSNVIEVDVESPQQFTLSQNYPNPFNPATIIQFNVPEESLIKVQVINGLGEVITSLADDYRQAGIYTETWTPQQIASGVYYIRMIAESVVTGKSHSQTIKAVYMK